jgi:thiol-disulfide isomerase/thioredoxin
MSRPPVFSDSGFASALEAAREQEKLLVVDATAEWCGPCKSMDRTTWIDPAVTDWIARHAIAVQIDVDAEPEIAKQLDVRAMPTLIAFKSGVEFDRTVGLKQPSELLAWLDGILRGETSLATLRAEVARRSGGAMERMNLARALASRGKLDEATDAYAWLWEHILEQQPEMFGVRASFLLAEITDLCARYAPARTRFSELRDAVAPRPRGNLEPEAVADWMLLNQALGEPGRSLEWFDRERQSLVSQPKLGRFFEAILIPLLVQNERWADAGALYGDPISTVREQHETIRHVTDLRPAGMDDATFEEVRRQVIENFQGEVRQVHRCLIAAGRSDEAAGVLVAARELDPTFSLQ